MHRQGRTFTMTAVALLFVSTVSLWGQASLLILFDLPVISPVPSCVNTASWNTYLSEAYGFLIKYPAGYIVAHDAFELAASGAVVTFIPAFDPSVDRSGARTNLSTVSVTVGVTAATATESHRGSSCPGCSYVRRLNGLEGGGNRFLRCERSEGAAGNRHSTLSYSTVCGAERYDIVLYWHCGNPYCYSPGTITPFDPTETLLVFEAIVDTFRCQPKGQQHSPHLENRAMKAASALFSRAAGGEDPGRFTNDLGASRDG